MEDELTGFITKTMELPLSHISMKSYNWVTYSGKMQWYNEDSLMVIPISDDQFVEELPNDLELLMKTARDYGCSRLVLDPAKEVAAFLPSYKETWKDAETMYNYEHNKDKEE